MAWNNKDLKNPKWQRTRLEIMQRDNWACTACGETEKTLNVHHIRYINDRKPWEYCHSDLQTMCEDCHSELHKIQKKYYSSSLQKKTLMWHKLIGGSEKIKRLIDHKNFIIIELVESKNSCIIIHVPSLKFITYSIPAERVYEEVIRYPKLLKELKTFVMEGASGNCKGPL